MTPFEAAREAMDRLIERHPEIPREHRIWIHNALQTALEEQRGRILEALREELEYELVRVA